jgi:hypothetical protein
MTFRSFLLIALSCCALAPLTARAAVLPGYATGSGANTASLVVDFDFVGGDAYFFQYRFDGDATAEDMLLALDAAGELTVHHQFFEFEEEGEIVRSIYIDGFSFGGNSAVPGFEGDAGENWGYWTADEPGDFVFWTNTVIGATDRLLADGSLDGWSLNVSPFNSKELDPTYFPPAVPPVPAVAGDTDGDGDVDDADLGAAFANYTGPVVEGAQMTSIQGDTDGDGDVDDADLGTAFANYTGPIGTTAVPEPASALLLLAGLSTLTRRRKRVAR